MSNAVPEGWSEDVIGSYVADSVAGEWGSEADGGDDDIPVLRATNFSESGAVDYRKLAIRSVVEKKRLKKSLQRGDIVLEKSGGSPTQPVGRVIYFDNDQSFLYSNFTQKLTPVSGCDSKYLFYKLYFEYQNGTVLKFQQQTTGIINFQLAEYLLFKSVFPPLPEQQKIATILSSVDDVIEKTQAQIDKLKDLKTGMMQELLTKGIGHTEFKDSPVGRIPVGWNVDSIGTVAKLTSGGTPNRERPDYWDGNIPWVKTGEINYATIFSTEENITEEGVKGSSAKIVPAGAVLMAMYGQGVTRGKVAMLGVESTMNQACLAMIPSDHISNYFLFYFLTREYENLRSLVQEGAQKNLSATIVKEILMPIPPLDEQARIVSGLKAVDQKLDLALEKIESMKNLKQALMQDLLTGKVRVNVDN